MYDELRVIIIGELLYIYHIMQIVISKVNVTCLMRTLAVLTKIIMEYRFFTITI